MLLVSDTERGASGEMSIPMAKEGRREELEALAKAPRYQLGIDRTRRSAYQIASRC